MAGLRHGGSVRASTVAALAGLAVLLVLVGMRAEHAAAGLHNPIPADASGDPTFDFTDNQSLWAYMTADLRGGRICVIGGSDGLGASCDHPVMGTPTRISADIGTVYTLVKNADLRPGTWRLLVEDSTDVPQEVSEPFTVTACADCPPDPDHDIVAAFKASAEDMGQRMERMCQLQGLLQKLGDKAIGLRGIDKNINIGVSGSVSLATPSFVLNLQRIADVRKLRNRRPGKLRHQQGP